MTDTARQIRALKRRSDLRTICPCQLHSGGLRDRFRHAPVRTAFAIVKRHSVKILLSGTLAVGGIGLPIRAMNIGFTVPRAAAAEKTVAVQVVEEQHRFRLVTDQVREQFFDPAPIDTVSIQLAQEEFFHSEIPFGRLIYREAKRHSLPPELLAAVVKAESDFRPGLVSGKNALGLMQIIPSTGELMGAKNLFDPEDNVRAGAKYLRYLTDRFHGDQVLILAAYNAGETNVVRFGGVPPFKETRDYLRRVSRARQDYQRALATHMSQSVQAQR